MNSSNVRHGVAQVIAEVSKHAEMPLDWTRSASDNGVDSLALLVFRELLELRFDIHISDEEWIRLDTLDDIVRHVERARGAVRSTGSSGAHGTIAGSGMGAAGQLLADGRMLDTVEVGMPMTGQNNLAENPLLKYLGHLRWTHISSVCGVRSRDITDAEGHRLYPTFFYVDLAFPEERHMGTFAENEQIRVICSLERFGGSMLDGTAILIPEERADDPLPAFVDPASALAAGNPVARLSNIFVKQFGGAEWLKKSRPGNPAFERIQEAPTPPDSYALVKAAERNGFFERPPDSFKPLTAGPVPVEYRLVPERDLNGAGLVYFANYPLFLDICERQALRLGRFEFPDAMLDRRALVRRRSAYLNNASSKDTVTVEVEAWLQRPEASARSTRGAGSIRLFANYRMRRMSDGRLMMVSSAEKLVAGHVFDDLPFAAEFLGGPRLD